MTHANMIKEEDVTISPCGSRKRFAFQLRARIVNSSSIILDLGCGTGSYALGLLEETHSTVIGLDPSSEMVNEGRLKDFGGDINWIESVAESIPIRNESIDLIFLSLVWHHLKDKHARAQSYTEY